MQASVLNSKCLSGLVLLLAIVHASKAGPIQTDPLVRMQAGSLKHPQYVFAHRVNSIRGISHALKAGANIECDIIWSRSRDKWVVQHDTPNLSRVGSPIETWFRSLRGALNSKKYDTTFSTLWLDIKSSNDNDLSKVLRCAQQYVPSSVNVIYDLGDAANVLQRKKGYTAIKSKLKGNEGIGVWLGSGEGNLVSSLIARLRADGITRSIVSHGHSLAISERTLKTIADLNKQNSSPYAFKKIFTWTNSRRSTMRDYIDPAHPHRTDRQIVGSALREWLAGDEGDVEDFKAVVREFSDTERLATRRDYFWSLALSPELKNYQIIVKTAHQRSAGTDSNIYVALHGSRGSTQEKRLNGLISGNAFERGDVDVVHLKFNDLGDLKSISVRSDGRYAGAGWKLDYIVVNGRIATFNRWIESGKLTASANFA